MTATPAALALDHVGLVYNGRRPDEVVALTDISLCVESGEFVTLVGSNGAGKSSMVGIVSGALRPTRGRVLIGGRDVTRHPDHRRARHIARVFDDPRVGTAAELSIEDNLALAMGRGSRHGLRWALSTRKRDRMRERLAALGLGLEDRLRDPVGMLSAGQRQSVTMIMAGLVRPTVLLLDEHLAALDPATADRVLALTASLAEETGAATLMVTHNMEHALGIGTRLLVMSRGRLIADVSGERKRAMDVNGVVELIVSAGDAVSDRSILPERSELPT
ncbi:ABC transporter ATP-binding protein [Streptomyces albus]|uniref:ABC transporter ATP-binding protein n=1 Tax=Streptomyces albus (strain ATCC 21838 / DSM 41398 / FERM P-419 / JCM 4703 / NBRC 107858) TaxID=1081613 RepID=A0A0B5EEQ3_STRA4|nr:ABC transporter ATP-binding protein [Streptomyces albus]AOU74733.1 ABC transporter ATP-binding protein [Streptomyces albus]AYN30544.1 ABC transporter ATP-binding protein [Streptomyces albus]